MTKRKAMSHYAPMFTWCGDMANDDEDTFRRHAEILLDLATKNGVKEHIAMAKAEIFMCDAAESGMELEEETVREICPMPGNYIPEVGCTYPINETLEMYAAPDCYYGSAFTGKHFDEGYDGAFGFWPKRTETIGDYALALEALKRWDSLDPDVGTGVLERYALVGCASRLLNGDDAWKLGTEWEKDIGEAA